MGCIYKDVNLHISYTVYTIHYTVYTLHCVYRIVGILYTIHYTHLAMCIPNATCI